ncbi:MAG: hypothetical protein NC307_13190 [Roseburia sp.]|nr:hypothetical protein [Roseburia sp.]
MVHLITGYAGKPHVTSSSDGAVNMGMYGKGKYILDIGEKFGYEIISNNLIKVKSGYAINQGRKIEIAINDYEEVTIDNGLQGMKRCDLIVLRYEKSPDSGIETASLVAIKGISGDAYTEPEYAEGDILAGEGVDDFLLHKVFISGLNIEKVESVFTVTKSGMEILEEYKGMLGQLDIKMTELGKSVADGKALVAKAISDFGYATAAEASFYALAESAKQMGNVRWNGGYAKGVSDADGRVLSGNATWNYLVELQHSSLLNGSNSFGAWIAVYQLYGHGSSKTFLSTASNGVYVAGGRTIMSCNSYLRIAGDNARYLPYTIQAIVGVGDIHTIITNPVENLIALWVI